MTTGSARRRGAMGRRNGSSSPTPDHNRQKDKGGKQ
jgi:hypothetical protein